VIQALRGLSGARRLLLLGAAAVIIAAIWWVSKWASEPTYVTLFRDLEFSDAAAIEEQLDKNNIRNRLGAGGAEVLVPVADVARARVVLAREGLQTVGRPGLELFDKPSWGMTDFTQRVTYQRALEGELARTISGLRGIQRAQVHLVLPTPSPLRRLERPASASVVIGFQQGTAPDEETVKGITYIVSNSVEHLSSDNVAVMDEEGHVLSVPSPGGSTGGAASWQLYVQRTVEEDLASKILLLLEPVVGVGRVRAQVAAELSFDQIDSTVESYDPDNQVLQAEQRTEVEPGSPGETAGSQTAISNTYRNSRRLERSIRSSGRLNHLTAAVLVDEEQMGTGSEGKVELADLEAMVRDAIGLDETRGDRLTVRAVPFEPLAVPDGGIAVDAQKPATNVIDLLERIGRALVGVIALAGLALLGLRLLRLPALAKTPAARQAALEGAGTGGAAALAEPGTAADSSALLKGKPGEPSDATAHVVRTWLAES
jgi:flagellar M-ring protein FliF